MFVCYEYQSIFTSIGKELQLSKTYILNLKYIISFFCLTPITTNIPFISYKLCSTITNTYRVKFVIKLIDYIKDYRNMNNIGRVSDHLFIFQGRIYKPGALTVAVGQLCNTPTIPNPTSAHRILVCFLCMPIVHPAKLLTYPFENKPMEYRDLLLVFNPHQPKRTISVNMSRNKHR